MKLLDINLNKLNNELIKKIFFSVKKEEYKYADYLVIYGCHKKELLNERLNHALKIINKKEVKKIVLTGGVGLYGKFNEAEYMKEYLIEKGINEDRLIIEDKSKTTLENDTNVIKLLDLKNIKESTNVVLVTHAAHFIRIILHWKKILKNSSIKLFYDYVDDTEFTYDNAINDQRYVKILKEQLKLIQEYINDGYFDDIDITR